MSLDFPGKPHPRNFGTFVRTLSHYCRDRGLFSLERAVQRQSALPAARLSLSDRGLIKSGMKADLVLFDFEKLEDLPDYQEAQRACSGIRRVYVNGILTVIDGTHTGAKAGMILRKEKNNNCIRV
jgi:N-acyl-D-amino-acid deacylase